MFWTSCFASCLGQCGFSARATSMESRWYQKDLSYSALKITCVPKPNIQFFLFDFCAFDCRSPRSMVNLEVWTGPEDNLAQWWSEHSMNVLEAGPVTSPGRWVDVSCLVKSVLILSAIPVSSVRNMLAPDLLCLGRRPSHLAHSTGSC